MSKKAKDQWVRIIDVSNPVLHKKGYTVYKVTSKVFPKNSVEAVTEVTVWKRYNDFKKLHKALNTIHQNLYLRDNFPAFAKARLFGRFDHSVIEERRLSALHLLQFAANCPPLFTSQVFVKFFEDGQVVEECKPATEVKKEHVENILQPRKCWSQSELLHSNSTECTRERLENGDKELVNTLGGTWQHHQVPDNISVGSHCTEDDDDRTTFTDDDSIVSKPSINLADFDPLIESNNESSNTGRSLSNQEDMCNSWLMSALLSCSSSSAEKDAENMLEFPVPFGDFEFSSECIIPSNESMPINSKDAGQANIDHFTFDLPVPATNDSCNFAEFDPLANKENDLRDSEDDLFKYDEFAMTPNSFKNECSRRPYYIVHASKYATYAQEVEEKGQYLEAFESYKKAIDELLKGIQSDKCSDLKDTVRKKVLLYLMRAEEIYENKLPKTMTDEISSSFPASPVHKVTNLQGCMQDLSKYKVIGILGKVLLVLDISNSTTYVVKTLYKSSSPRTFDVPPLLPQSVPFMVKLYHIYETNYALFLILEHATGGRLWDYVSSFLHRSPLSPSNDGTLYVEFNNKIKHSNVYSGKKICEGNINEITNSLDSDLTASKNCSSSYVALFKRYAASVDMEDNVALAKYRNLTPAVCTDENSDAFNGRTLSVLSQGDGDTNTSICNRIHYDGKKQKKSARNRLSSSTGSLETALSQKPCHLEAFNAMDEAVNHALSNSPHLPESCVYLWAAEMVAAIESLHNLGITWVDLHPDNILLGAEGHILLTYQSQWNNVDFIIRESAKENLFCAPEVNNVFPVTPDCDWWSLGVILFELLTGQELYLF